MKVSEILAKAKGRAKAAAALGRSKSSNTISSEDQEFIPGRDNNDADDFDRRELSDSQSP